MLENFRRFVNGGSETWFLEWSAPNPGLLIGLGLVVGLVAYFLGCFNGAVIVSKYVLKDDVRAHGSGNAGLTNFHRTFGGGLTLVVILLDVVKAILAVWFGQLAVWLAGWPGLDVLAKYWAGLFCLLGHMYPCMFGFKGGKGVLSGVALMFCLDWRMGLIAMGIFLVAVFLTRYVSLGSCLGTVSFPVGTWLFVTRDDYLVLAMSFLMAALVIFMHRGNLRRVFKGEERRFSLHHQEKK